MPEGERGLRVPYLRAWRKHNVMTQAQLAERAKVGRSTLTRAELGKPISIPNVQDLAKALGVDVQQLLHEDPRDTKAEPAA